MSAWIYRRPAARGIIELGIVRGSEVGLPTHFHAEDQFTFVLAGRRRFVFGERPVAISSGQGTLIPAGTPHSSLSEPDGVVCINVYFAASQHPSPALLQEITGLLRGMAQMRVANIAEAVRGCWPLAASHPFKGAACGAQMDVQTVAQAAVRVGMSREGFSRKFHRAHGMSPGAFWAMRRLNDARQLLRSGIPIAAVAAETGFADQSHFGRFFRRAFGVTPGQYRSALAVTNVPDAIAGFI